MKCLFKVDIKKAASSVDKWFEQLCEDGEEAGVYVEPLTVRERSLFEHKIPAEGPQIRVEI